MQAKQHRDAADQTRVAVCLVIRWVNIKYFHSIVQAQSEIIFN